MRLRSRKSPLLLLLIPTLAATAAVTGDSKFDKDAVAKTYSADAITDGSAALKKYGTKDAPVDGKDGKPHAGPFVEYERQASESKDFPVLKDRPVDPTIVDGKKIPETNDGVMDDKNRPEPKEGTTGTGGGVSEKDKQRKKKESQTGEKVENKPQTPKEVPPLAHAEEEKILREKEGKTTGKASEGASGLEVSSHPPL
jgi:Ca2+/H+ antiporter, TMEM165/GDT1 family